VGVDDCHRELLKGSLRRKGVGVGVLLHGKEDGICLLIQANEEKELTVITPV